MPPPPPPPPVSPFAEPDVRHICEMVNRREHMLYSTGLYFLAIIPLIYVLRFRILRAPSYVGHKRHPSRRGPRLGARLLGPR